MRIVILASGKGSNAETIFKKIKSNELRNVEVCALISDNPDAPALNVAQRYGVKNIWLDPMRKGARFTEESSKNYVEYIKSLNVDLIVLAGFMRILPENFIEAFTNKTINLHPSLLPSFKGKDAIKQAYEAKVEECGCTVHFVNNELDGGKIISQKRVPIYKDDTLETLEERVHQAEHELLPQVISDIASSKIEIK